MLSQSDVSPRSKNFTSHTAIRMPPSVPLNIISDQKTEKIERKSYFIISCTRHSPALSTQIFSNTNFLTAIMTIYTLRVGSTADAGIRLALS
ncbi:unnamed protein product [Onchocerca ochengi]|uniref:Uncharacterized protein n=1 Tax=Onchocerca ochengi TaxID=42157 RepID=A0A182E433_ONCOC|nr:unnamed protein product [Onchocerca ochengi]